MTQPSSPDHPAAPADGDVVDAGMALYDRYADRIHDLVLFLTRDAAAAAEATGDVVVMTAARRRTPRVGAAEEPAVRAWVYAQARTEAFSILNARSRLPAEHRVVEVPGLPDAPTPADLAGIAWSATAAFAERDLALVTLHLRHGLADEDLADALGLSRGAVDVLLPPALDRVSTQVRALLVAASATGPCCAPLDDLRDGWDGTFSPMVRRRAADLADACPRWDDPALAPLPLLQSVPLVPAPPGLREVVRTRLELVGSMGAHVPGGASSAEIDRTVPPGDDLTTPLAVDAPTPPPPPPPPAAVARTGPVGAAPASGTPAGSGPPASAPRRRRIHMPRVLAVALGVALALAVAAGVFRVVVAEGGPIQPTAAALGASAAADRADGPAADDRMADAPTSAALAPPGTLTVPAAPVEIPADGPGPLRLTNVGGTPVNWQVVSAPDWVVLDRTEGTVEPGAPSEVEVHLADGLGEGDYAGQVVLRWDGAASGTVSSPVQGAVGRPPRLVGPQVGARDLRVEGCGLDSTEVAVAVEDESPVVEVLATATGPGADDQAQVVLAPVPDEPGRFLGVLGPFAEAGDVALRFSATDVRGLTGEVDAGGVAVVGC